MKIMPRRFAKACATPGMMARVSGQWSANLSCFTIMSVAQFRGGVTFLQLC